MREGTRAPLRALLLLAVCATARGQTCEPGDLRVLVKDSQAAPIFNAQVRLRSGALERPAQLTDTNGLSDFTAVACGAWIVTAGKAGFDDSKATVQVGATPVVGITLTLNPAINRTSVDVTDTAPPIEQTSSRNYELQPQEVKTLPANPITVSDVLPLIPGVVRSPLGELKFDGAGEQRSSLVVNQSDVTDPATGKFGQTVPVDAIDSVNVLNTPFLAQYGRFTQSVVAVETRRGGDKWHYDLNDPFPDFFIRSYHMQGIRNETPRASMGGPLIKDRLYLNTAFQYVLDKIPSRTLSWGQNVSKQERVNSFTQLDYLLSTNQVVNFTYHFNPDHTNFVNPDYFTPQSVAPSYAQRAYEATLSDLAGLWGGTLNSSVAYQRFHTFTGAQGPAGEIVTPEGDRGNYFGVQTHDAFRREWLEIWSPAPVTFFGKHQVKVGSSFTLSTDHGLFRFRPVNVLDSNGRLLENITYSLPTLYTRNDLEVTTYVQDHWSPTATFSIDGGFRLEHQRLAQSLRIAPRTGLSWAPFANERTVFRAGYGEFYDHIPMDVYAFSQYPSTTITNYAADGSVLGVPEVFANVIGSATGPRSFLVHGQRVAGAFSPRGSTWNAQLEHGFSKLLRVRAVYTDNRSVGLIVLHPAVFDGNNEIVLDGSGRSRYRQAEVTARLSWDSGQQLVFSYTHSRAQGDQNTFDSFVGNFAQPFIRPDVYSNLPGDLPNRLVIWGRVKVPFEHLELLPTIEYRSGFPYIAVDALQNYVGGPNRDSTRFPNFLSTDARLMRDFKVSAKYTLRLSVSGFNLTNHFNALVVHSNVTDPEYGTFFGNYHRKYRFDFEVLF